MTNKSIYAIPSAKLIRLTAFESCMQTGSLGEVGIDKDTNTEEMLTKRQDNSLWDSWD